MLVVNGDAQEIGRARELLKATSFASFDHHTASEDATALRQ